MNDANRIVIEACVGDFEDAVAAAELGVDRLEFCSALEVGGLTPSALELRRLRETVEIPIVAMVRPRPGDFNYSRAELRMLLDDALRMLDIGVDGLVFGALTPDRRIDAEVTSKFVELIGSRPGVAAVFHKAFDETGNKLDAWSILSQLGIDRVLTSGGALEAAEGTELLKTLVTLNPPTVLLGGGIRAENVEEILRITDAREIHSSCRDTSHSAFRFDRNAFASLVAVVRRFQVDSAGQR